MTAADALARRDYGLGSRPGDDKLIALFEAYCQRGHARLEHARSAREHAEYLASCCPGCVEGGAGEVCDDCWAAGYGPEPALAVAA